MTIQEYINYRDLCNLYRESIIDRIKPHKLLTFNEFEECMKLGTALAKAKIKQDRSLEAVTSLKIEKFIKLLTNDRTLLDNEVRLS